MNLLNIHNIILCINITNTALQKEKWQPRGRKVRSLDILPFILSAVIEYRELLKKHNVEENLMDARCTDELFVELMEEEMKVDDVAPRLGLSETDITNALRGKKTEGTRRLAILREWKRQNGTDAICKTLVITLLKVKDQVTAEAVIVFAKENYFAPGE